MAELSRWQSRQTLILILYVCVCLLLPLSLSSSLSMFPVCLMRKQYQKDYILRKLKARLSYIDQAILQ
jgi:hypothetical protein